LDDDDVQTRVEQFNSALEAVCKNTNSVFIENDPSFRLGDGDINAGFLQDDGHSLNTPGKDKLLKNLRLHGLVSTSKVHPWQTTTRERLWKTQPSQAARSAPSTQQKKAPCWNCGEPNHTSNICKFRKRLTCHKCGKLGHKAPRCGQN
jgi:hypothetical protein